MMYWIVFALFTTLETFLDIFFSWFPFYYEIKIIFILWVLSPATRGSSLLYKNVVHPMLISREKEIDDLTTDKNGPYWNKNHPSHNKVVNQVLALREMLSQ